MAYTSDYHRFKCNLCGLPIGGCPREWLNEFRALYTRGFRWNEPRISGIGWNVDTRNAVVPTDPETRYDDEGGGPQSMIDIFLFRPHRPKHADPSESSWEGRPWGFLMHASCWTILEAASAPKVIDLLTLFTFMMSLPTGFVDVLHWCHTYGGIYELQFGPDVAPVESDTLQMYRTFTNTFGSEISALEVYDWDPLAPPFLQQWIKESVKDSYACTSAPAHSGISADGACDGFARLPIEIRESILGYLPSEDVLQAMLASRSFSSIALSQTFWRTRFARGFELDFVFEALQRIPSSKQYRDCRNLYHAIYRVRDTRIVENRQRVWYLLQPLADLLADYSGSSPSGEPLSTVWDNRHDPDLKSWRTMSAHRLNHNRGLRSGCRTLFIRQIFLLWRDIKEVRASIMNLGSATYVTGMQFISRNGSVVDLGYILPNLETVFEEDRDLESGITGISVIAGTLGFHAITVFGDGNSRTEWAGSPTDGNVSTIMMKRARYIKGHFDVRLPAHRTSSSELIAAGP